MDYESVPRSDEVLLFGVIMGCDWEARSRSYANAYQALGEALQAESSPSRVIELTELKHGALVRAIGARSLDLCASSLKAECSELDRLFDV